MIQSTFVGLDAHAKSVVACELNPAIAELQHTKMSAEPEVVISWIQRFPTDTKAVYDGWSDRLPTGPLPARTWC